MSQLKNMENDEIEHLAELLKKTPYKPISRISEGSFGEVYKVQDDQKQYALKVISKERMIREGKLHEAVIQGFILSRMNHPAIVKYYQTIETKEYICHVIEYCPFGDLFGVQKKISRNMDLIEKKKDFCLYYLAQILDGLSHIHSKQLIHRDLKLENIVMAADLTIRIIDFGTAKPVSMQQFYSANQILFINNLRNKTLDVDSDEQACRPKAKSLVGSANYLSPESISMNYSLSSDVWSYGVLVYKMFHGKLPFEGENNFQIFKKIKENNIIINEKIEPDAHDLITKCLKLSPEERPTCQMLKKHSYFKSVNFEQINQAKPPISREVMQKLFSICEASEPVPEKQVHYEIPIEKKMFFGNYKPRVLKVYERGESLYMSYWYLDGKSPKNEFELQINDYAQVISKTEFEVCNGDVKYTFKVGKNTLAEVIVGEVNAIIRKHYQLE